MTKSNQEESISSQAEMLVLRNYEEKILKPVAPIAIVSEQLEPALSDAINFHLRNRRARTIKEFPEQNAYPGYYRADYRISVNLNRYSSGEGHVRLLDSVRGHDLFILTDVLNYGQFYQRFNQTVSISPDEHFEDLCRIISAAHGVAKRINIFMPYLYEGRRYRRTYRESLDCSVMLRRLFDLGIDNFVTFDAHDDRISNAVPRRNFESVQTSLQLIEALLKDYHDLKIDKENFMVVSADEASIKRCIYYASLMQVPLGIFYRRYDPRLLTKGQYSKQYLKTNAEKKFLGDNIEGKDILIVDDMIDTGVTALECAMQLKEQGAARVFVAVSFAQFSKGFEKFNQAYESGIITRVYSTNLAYRSPVLLNTEWYRGVNLSKYLALLIDGYNHDAALSNLINPTKRIKELLKSYKGASHARE